MSSSGTAIVSPFRPNSHALFGSDMLPVAAACIAMDVEAGRRVVVYGMNNDINALDAAFPSSSAIKSYRLSLTSSFGEAHAPETNVLLATPASLMRGPIMGYDALYIVGAPHSSDELRPTIERALNPNIFDSRPLYKRSVRVPYDERDEGYTDTMQWLTHWISEAKARDAYALPIGLHARSELTERTPIEVEA